MTRLWAGASEKALKTTMRGDVLLARGEAVGARAAYEEATAQSPQIVSAQLNLAVLLDSTNQVDAAIERYRRTLASQPTNVTALNNLAYRLAIDKKSPAEALPLAQQAIKLDQSSTVADTLAWIQHLLGDPAAVRTMAAALRSAPNNADIRLHAAVIYAAAGARAVAEDQLKAALTLNPSLENSLEVKQVREQLQKRSTQESPSGPPRR
jgi:Tfp pilus assembly protein PilF